MRPGFWRKCRICFRWFRISVLLLVLAAAFSFVWFNRIGLPDFLKTRLVEALHSRGIKLEFSRMRLRVERGIVAENVRIGDSRNPGSPALTLAEMELRLNYRALLRRQFEVDGLILRQGDLRWPVSPTNMLTLYDIQTNLRFQTNNTWSLDNFTAGFAGARLNLSGEIAHAPEVLDWKIFQGQKSTDNPAQLQKILDALARIHFEGSPELSLAVNGDARDIHSINVRLDVAQGRTQLALDGGVDDAVENYHWHAAGALDLEFVRPYLPADAVRGMDIFKPARPVFLDANGRGRFGDPDSIGVAARVALTNFMVRGETFGDLTTVLYYKNRVLEFLKPLTHTGAQMMTADSVTLDFNKWMIYFTNGFSTADPQSIVRAIGPKTAEIMEPYHFLEPPTGRVNGQIPLGGMNGGPEMAKVDMRFDIIKGTPFEWMKFRTTNITGTIHWQGQLLGVTNVSAAFYGGSANGFADFDFRVPHEGADYDFAVNMTNVDLHLLSVNLSSQTNSLEGALSGRLVVTRADTRDWRTWDGYGHAALRNGLIWDEPIFGMLSPVLNTFSPGLGSSRATEASADFTMTNGVIYSSSLEIHTMLAQLKYAGKVDMSGNVNMNVTALLLRNTPVVGQAVSWILTPFTKLFEYHVTGTLEKPISAPVYVPKFLLMPLHPIRSIEELFPAGVFPDAPPGN
jgi:hypothetical protein